MRTFNLSFLLIGLVLGLGLVLTVSAYAQEGDDGLVPVTRAQVDSLLLEGKNMTPEEGRLFLFYNDFPVRMHLRDTGRRYFMPKNGNDLADFLYVEGIKREAGEACEQEIMRASYATLTIDRYNTMTMSFEYREAINLVRIDDSVMRVNSFRPTFSVRISMENFSFIEGDMGTYQKRFDFFERKFLNILNHYQQLNVGECDVFVEIRPPARVTEEAFVIYKSGNTTETYPNPFALNISLEQKIVWFIEDGLRDLRLAHQYFIAPAADPNSKE